MQQGYAVVPDSLSFSEKTLSPCRFVVSPEQSHHLFIFGYRIVLFQFSYFCKAHLKSWILYTLGSSLRQINKWPCPNFWYCKSLGSGVFTVLKLSVMCTLQMSGASITVHDPKPGDTNSIVVICGDPEQTKKAQSLIHAFIFCGLCPTWYAMMLYIEVCVQPRMYMYHCNRGGCR